MSAVLFERDGALYLPTEHARGPWDPMALHGGAPAALITTAFEAAGAGEQLRIGRLSFELLRPVPMAPLALQIGVARAGRRVQELHALLSSDGREICRAGALLVQEVPAGLPAAAVAEPGPDQRMPGPEHGSPIRFALDQQGEGDPDGASFGASAMEMSWLDEPWSLGPARVWMRPRVQLLEGEPMSPLALAAATADFGNGISAALPFEHYVFINADLTLHLHRQPRGEWIGLDARTFLPQGGVALAESAMHDIDGPIGRAFQTLVVGPR